MKFHIFIEKSMKINFDRFVPHEIGSPSSKITLPGPKTKQKIDFWLKTADFLKKLIFWPWIGPQQMARPHFDSIPFFFKSWRQP